MKKLSNIIIIATVLLVISLLWGTTLHYNYHFDSKEKPILYYTFENSNVVKLYYYLLGERHSEPIDRTNLDHNKLYLRVEDGKIYKGEKERICHQAIIPKEKKKQDDNPVVRFEMNPEYVSYQRLNNGDYLKLPLDIPGNAGEPLTPRWSGATIIEK